MEKTFYIIDNETDSINRIHNLFEEFPEYHCVGVSDGYDVAMNTILKYSPRIIFANIDMKLGNNTIFNFANELYHYKTTMPVFFAISAYKDRAYDVLKNSFFDLLLKPLREFDIRRTLMRFDKQRIEESKDRLCLKSYKDYRFVSTDQILYLKADNNSTDIFMTDGKTISGYQPMKYFEEVLPDNFIRIHHSYIINIDHVIRIHFGKSKCVVRNVNAHIPFSRTYRGNVELLRDALAKSSIFTLN